MTDLKPLALVTGAVGGTGFELAKLFAEHEFDLVMSTEDEELDTAADEIRAHGADVLGVRADLATRDGVERLQAALVAGARPVVAAALGTGAGRGGAFVDAPLADAKRVIDLNITSTVWLAKGLLRDMADRGTGGLLFTPSPTAGPGAERAVYDASTAFLRTLAEELREELAATGVTVASVLPDPAPARARAGVRPDDPERVARRGFDALMTGGVRDAGTKTKAQEFAHEAPPRTMSAELHRAVAKSRPVEG